MDTATLKTTYKTEVETIKTDIEKEQSAYVKINKKHKQVLPVMVGDIEKSVTEYVCPDGSVGYQIILKKKDGKDEYVKTIGYGKEAEDRTQDWQKVIKLIGMI